MNYIYDILLNFNEKFYEFYEWDDNIIHIKKIPCFKISEEQLKIIYDNKVKIDLKQIFNKTEVFNKKNIEYACILYSNNYCFAIKLNNKGIIKERSSLLFDDMDDVIDKDEEEIKLDIKVLEPLNQILIIKEEYDINVFLNKEIDKLILNKEYSKLNYIYYECFNNKEDNINIVINKLKDNLINYSNKIYEILNLTTK